MKDRSRVGRIGLYEKWLEEDNLLLLEAWARDGLTDEQIAKNIGIAPKTLYRWKNKYSQICQSLKKGKEIVDYEAENALLKRALGYEIEEVKTYIEDTGDKKRKRIEKTIKHIPPDVTACIFWLKNRKPKGWRDKQKVEHQGNIEVNIIDNIPRSNVQNKKQTE